MRTWGSRGKNRVDVVCLWGFSPECPAAERERAMQVLTQRGVVICSIDGTHIKAHKGTVYDHLEGKRCKDQRAKHAAAVAAALSNTDALGNSAPLPPPPVPWAPQKHLLMATVQLGNSQASAADQLEEQRQLKAFIARS